ncbi:MAG: hypothetical protein WB507_00505 [Solirubrobacterales bacterium]
MQSRDLDSGFAPAVHVLALLIGAAALALLAFAGFKASSSAGAEIPIVEVKMSASGEIAPAKLPRTQPAPATLRLGFTSESLGEPTTPELTRIALEISRNVTLQTTGLPSCPLSTLYLPSVGTRALCARSLVGHGSVTSEITLPGQAPVKVAGRLLAFYGIGEGRPRVLAQVTTGSPLPLTYVIPFEIEKAQGVFGTSLIVPKMSGIRGKCAYGHPNCFAQPYTLKGVYSHISKFELSLKRSFTHSGKRKSFVSAECPTRGRMTAASFPLAKVGLNYDGGLHLSSVVSSRCEASQ